MSGGAPLCSPDIKYWWSRDFAPEKVATSRVAVQIAGSRLSLLFVAYIGRLTPIGFVPRIGTCTIHARTPPPAGRHATLRCMSSVWPRDKTRA